MKPNPADVQRFRRDGFLGIDRLIDDETVKRIRTYYGQLISGEIPCGEDNRKLGGQVHQIMHPRLHHEYFRSNPALDEAMEAASVFIGRSDVKFIFDMLIDRPPLTEKSTPWHQDEAYAQIPFTPAGAKIENMGVQFWIALDDVDVENGCMQFIPGVHYEPLLQHEVVSGEPGAENRLLVTRQVDPSKAVPVPLKAGGCTVHYRGTPHFTGPNRSATRQRRAYIFNIG